jgi:hypothetical protein
LSEYRAGIIVHARAHGLRRGHGHACRWQLGRRGNDAFENRLSKTLILIIRTPYSWGETALDNGRGED